VFKGETPQVLCAGEGGAGFRLDADQFACMIFDSRNEAFVLDRSGTRANRS
jgi:hypothetical protein